MNTVHRLTPNRERIKRAQARERLEQIAQWDLPEWLQRRLESELWRASEPNTAKPALGYYAMLNVVQMAAIWDWIRTLPANKRPQEVRHVLDIALLNLRQDTGEILLRRDEIAERMKVRPAEVSQAMRVLQDAGIIITRRIKVDGMRGPGISLYFINPHAAWNGAVATQENEAARQPPPGPLLTLMQGGKADEPN